MSDLDQVRPAHFPPRLYFLPARMKQLDYYPYKSYPVQRFRIGGFCIISSLGFWPLEILSMFSRRHMQMGSLWVVVLQGGGYGSEDLEAAVCRKAHRPCALDALNV